MSEPRGFRQVPWVMVSADDVAGHPKGRPGLAIYLICGWCLIIAALYLTPFVIFPFGQVPISFIFWGVLALNASVFLALGSLLGWILTLLMGLREVVLFIAHHASGQGSRIHQMINALMDPVAANYAHLSLVVAGTVVVLHLWEGDRPNLIYRHRYRKYSEIEDR